MSQHSGQAVSVFLAILLAGAPARASFGWTEPSENDTRVVLQGNALSATYVLKLRCRMESEALQIAKLMFDLAKRYPSATALTVAIRIDVSEAEERYGIRDRGVMDLDQISVNDLSDVRKSGSYQSLLYGNYFWLPSRLQTGVERLLMSAGKQH